MGKVVALCAHDRWQIGPNYVIEAEKQGVAKLAPRLILPHSPVAKIDFGEKNTNVLVILLK